MLNCKPAALLLWLLLPAGLPLIGHAQQLVPQRTTLPVKQFEEFLKRFYYLQTPDQRPLTTDSLRALYPRRGYLLSLFDGKDARRTQADYKRAVDAFALETAEMTERPADLYAGVLAETPFRAAYRGKSETLTTYWRMVRINRAQGWRLVGVAAPFLSALPDSVADDSAQIDTLQTTTRPLTLAPNVHETSFLAFQTLVRQGQDLGRLLSDSLGHSGLGRAFVRAVRQHELTLTETERVTLFVPTNSGWIVRVDEFPRDDDNSGWLISDLYGPLSPPRLPTALVPLITKKQ